jgi:hypothetical protein
MRAIGDLLQKPIMVTVFSNGPSQDFVIKPFTDLLSESTNVYITAPYVTETTELLEAAKHGKQILLLPGLNSVTNPDALSKIHGTPNIQWKILPKKGTRFSIVPMTTGRSPAKYYLSLPGRRTKSRES